MTAWGPPTGLTTVATLAPPPQSATWWMRRFPASHLWPRCREFTEISVFKISLVMESQPRITAAMMTFFFAMEQTMSVWTKVLQGLVIRSAAVMGTCKTDYNHWDKISIVIMFSYLVVTHRTRFKQQQQQQQQLLLQQQHPNPPALVPSSTVQSSCCSQAWWQSCWCEIRSSEMESIKYFLISYGCLVLV